MTHRNFDVIDPHSSAPRPCTRFRGGPAMTTLLSAPQVTATVFLASADVQAIVRLALGEDIGRGDLTTEATVAPEATATAEILQKAPGVLCGLPVVETVFSTIDPRVQVNRLAEEGSYTADRRRAIAQVSGPA